MPHDASVQPEASTVSTGSGLRYVGNRVYAYSGTFTASVSTQTCLEFTTGSGIIVGDFFYSGGVNYVAANLGDGQNTGYRLTLNGEIASIVKLSSITESMPTTATLKVILPPFTIVQLEILSSADSGGQLSTCSFSGRVYGAE